MIRQSLARLCLAIAALLAATSCHARESLTAAEVEWSRLVTAEPISPVPAGGDALYERWKRPDGKGVLVAVRQPVPSATGQTISLQPSGADMQSEIQSALDKLQAAGGGTLRLGPGAYPIGAPRGPDLGAIQITRLTDVTIEGVGARLVFAQWGDGLRIANSRRLAIRGVTLEYLRPAIVRAKVEAAGRHKRLVAVTAGAALWFPVIYQVTRYDPMSRGYPDGGERLLFGQGGVSPANGQAMAGLAIGGDVMVKLSYYLGAAIRVADRPSGPESEDIVIDGVRIGSSSGTGITVDAMGRGLAIINSQIGPEDGGDPTIPFDGIHVTASAGDILIRNNRISGTGDDAINLAGRIEPITVAAGADLVMEKHETRLRIGDPVALFDSELNFLSNANVASVASLPGSAGRRVGLAGLRGSSGQARYARNLARALNRYAIVENTISRCECHGVLVQSPNGLVAGNTFKKLRYNAIRLLSSATWLEGVGAHQVVVRGNRISDTGSETKPGFIWGAISIYGEIPEGSARTGRTRPANGPVNTGLLIEGNTVDKVADGCIAVASAAGVSVRANRCSNYGRRRGWAVSGVDRANLGNSIARSAAALAYLRGGTGGVWIDPLTTTHVEDSL